jgi:hypothetical protein
MYLTHPSCLPVPFRLCLFGLLLLLLELLGLKSRSPNKHHKVKKRWQKALWQNALDNPSRAKAAWEVLPELPPLPGLKMTEMSSALSTNYGKTAIPIPVPADNPLLISPSSFYSMADS